MFRWKKACGYGTGIYPESHEFLFLPKSFLRQKNVAIMKYYACTAQYVSFRYEFMLDV